MNSTSKAVNDVLDLIQAVLISLLIKLGPFFVALMPASFTGYATYQIFIGFGENWLLALAYALIVAAGFETVGIVVTHTAIDLYNALLAKQITPAKFWTMLLMIPVYAVAVIGVIWWSETTFPPLVKGIAFASPFFTIVVYTAVALSRDLSNIIAKIESETGAEQAEKENEKIWKRKKEQDEIDFLEKQRTQHQANLQERALAKIDAGEGVQQGVKETRKNAKIDVFDTSFDTVNLSRAQKKKELIDDLLDIYLHNPLAGATAVSRSLGVSRQSIYNYLDELEETNIIRRNGDGVEVIR